MTAGKREKEIYKVTALGSAVNVLLTILKFVGGFIGRSSAMIADAVHSLSDLITDFIVFIFVKTAAKPSDRTHEYGHGKFETLASFLVGCILLLVGLGIFIEGLLDCIRCLRGHVLPKPGWIALAVALISILSKEGLYHITLRVGKKWNSEVVIANAWHHRSDSISSIATLLGIAGAMFFGVKWRILDPMAATLVSFFIIKVGYDVIKPSVDELLERSLPPETEKRILEIVNAIEDITEISEVRTRKIGNNIAIEFDAFMDPDLHLSEADSIADDAECRLKEAFGPETHIGIRIKPCKTNK